MTHEYFGAVFQSMQIFFELQNMSNITIGNNSPPEPYTKNYPTWTWLSQDFNDVLDPAPAVLARSKSHVTLKSEAVTCQMPWPRVLLHCPALLKNSTTVR